jgi:hypothetical protein
MDNPAHACQRAAAGFPTGPAVDSSHLRAATGKISLFTLESSVQTLAYRIFGASPNFGSMMFAPLKKSPEGLFLMVLRFISQNVEQDPDWNP